MDPRVTALISGQLDLTTLSATELHDLRVKIGEAFAEVDVPDDQLTEDSLAQMGRITEALDRVAAEQDGRAATAERVTRAGDMRRRATTIPEPPAPPAVEQPADSGEPVAEPDPAVREPELVTAAATPPATTRPSLAQLAHRANPTPLATTRPRAIRADTSLVAAANMPGLSFGQPTDFKALSRATLDKLRLLAAATTEEKVITASLAWEYPADRRLTGDPERNSEIMDGALSYRAITESVEEQGGLEAVVAAGGVCGPLPVDYSVDVEVSEARPLRDALPSFQATRGGLRYIPRPTLAGVGTSATAVWTAANDVTPSSPSTKPVQEFDCPTPVEVLVDAISTRFQFSNFNARYSPEFIAANTMLAMAGAARIAEINLLTNMAAGSIKTGASAVLSSFTRDFFALAELLAAGYRYRHRLPNGENGQPVFPLQVVLPSWVKGAFRTDFLRETAHDRSNASSDQLAIADSYIAGLFAARGLVPIYTMDALPKSVAATTLSAASAFDYPDQTFIAPATTAAMSAAPADASAGSASAGTWWPTRLAFFMFAAGTWVFLDGGRIDLGVIRDSTLNATNKYQSFVEPFEAVAKRGAESLLVSVPLNLTGVSVSTASAPAASARVY